MTVMYFIRHGQSLGNLEGRFLGHTDRDLSPLGYKQAELTAKYFENIHIDAVYSSDLLRSVNTVAPTARQKGLSVIPDENLREIACGKWENEPFDWLKTQYEDDYGIWLNDIGNAVCTGGESVRELCDRIGAECRKIAADWDGKTVIIGTHAVPIRCMTTVWNGEPITEMKSHKWVSNASVTRIIYENGVGRIDLYGYDEHLGELHTALGNNV